MVDNDVDSIDEESWSIDGSDLLEEPCPYKRLFVNGFGNDVILYKEEKKRKKCPRKKLNIEYFASKVEHMKRELWKSKMDAVEENIVPSDFS